MNSFAFDFDPMRARREEYFRFARRHMPTVFRADGTYQPATENDSRIPYWLYPALVRSPDAKEREFANGIYASAPNWETWDVFTTSSTAVNLVREREHMRPDLVKRSEQHLAKFVVRDGGRAPCSGANDYIFHGYNDNMPAMSVRAMILAGDALGRKDYTDQGLFYLEGLCAHFERRGLLSEYSSGTYTAITLTALLDVAECSTHREAREMALASANRILLDVFGHWHQHVGGIGGAQSRSYTADLQECLSTMNALMWYLTGSPMCVHPIEALSDIPSFPGYVHHARNFAFNLAQFAEVMGASFECIAPGVRDFCAAPRAYPYEIHATTDSGQAGLLGGVKEIQTRAFHQPLYALGTASDTWFDQSGQQATLHAVLAAVPQPATWRDRVAVWHKTIEGALDQGDLVSEGDGPHSSPKTDGTAAAPLTETGHVNDFGKYHVTQKHGSALVLGSLGQAMLGREVRQLKFSLVFGTFLRMPEEVVEEDRWHFLRFGDVYIGARLSGMVEERKIAVRRVTKNKYVRLELPLVADSPVTVRQEFREWCDFGYVFEIAGKDECGSFERFRQECRSCTWEWYHGFYRNSRYSGRHGELQIIDSVAADTVRFMAVDGAVEPGVRLAATGLDPKLTQLFPDGHRVKQRRIAYHPDYVGSPFYKHRAHILEKDVPVIERS
jgi:hypothetical protein